MKIKSVHLRGFKRFTELRITDIPESAKLVVLVGPNGAGKSSLFEAFNVYLKLSKGNPDFDGSYHVKTDVALPFTISNWSELAQNVTIEFHDFLSAAFQKWSHHKDEYKKAFYIRSSYRHEADFVLSSLERKSDILNDDHRPNYIISPDNRVSDNYQRMVARTIEEVYDNTEDTKTKKEIRERLIGSVRESLVQVFGDLEFAGLGNPLENGTFFFKKGATRNWRYKNLSGGEKAAFDLLVDFVVKIEKFDNTVFCIDEPELHLHTRTQGLLLQEFVSRLPASCQLWIATHSIGFMRKAKELAESKPGEVVFLDFANQDFDKPAELKPAITNRAFWKRTFSVAIDDLVDLVAPSTIVFCEGSQSSATGTRNGEFDARCYGRIFSNEYPDVEFVSIGSASEVQKNSLLLTTVFQQVLSAVKVSKVVDRDDRSETEVRDLHATGVRVLSKRHIESFLFDDEILTKLCQTVGQADKAIDILAAKSRALAASVGRGNPKDDYKSMSPQLCNEIKRILQLTQCGNSKEAFCIDTLTPLVTPETGIYQQLRKDVLA